MKTLKTALLQATRNFIIERKGIPYIVANYSLIIDHEGHVPECAIGGDGATVTLNCSNNACRSVEFADHMVILNMDFGGVPTTCFLPYAAIIAVYDRDNVEDGIQFSVNTMPNSPKIDDKPSFLRVVK